MLSYYLTAAVAFTLGFLAAAVLTLGRRTQASRDRAWLAEEVAKFARKCRSRQSAGSSTEEFVVERRELAALEEAAGPANPQASDGDD